MSHEDIEPALFSIPADDRETWVTVGMAIKSELGEPGFDMWDQWSQQASSYRAEDAKTVWRSIKPDGGIKIGTLFKLARDHGYRDDAGGHQDRPAVHPRPGLYQWEQSLPCTSHPYLTRKQVEAFGELRVDFYGNLLVPMRDIDGNWRGMQRIPSSGEKKTAKGTKKTGAMYWLGDLDEFGVSGAAIYVAEGYATAASVRMAVNAPVVCAFDAYNLLPVAKAIRKKYPNTQIVIAADDDRDKESNTGRNRGIKAAQAVGGLVALPDLGDAPGTDFNDLHVARGLDAVRNDLSKAAPPPGQEALKAEAIKQAVEKSNAIVVRDGELAGMVDECAKALREYGAPIYQRGGSLVRVLKHQADEEDLGIRRFRGAITLRAVDHRWLQLQLSKATPFVKWNRREQSLVPTDAPERVALILAEVPDAAPWPRMRAIAQHPVIFGTEWIGKSGYYRGLLLDLDGWAWKEPGRTRDDAEQALKRLRHHLRYYEFASGVAEAVAISLLLSSVHRPMMETVPLHAIDAPVRGSGKSLMQDVAAILGTGARASVMDFCDNRAEADKRLDAALLAGDSFIAIDNIERPLGGVGLCQALTQVAKDVRPLGSSIKVSVPCTNLFTATGNNIQLDRDMDRRVLFCRLDPKTERPELRDIDQDLITETLERRAELVADCQTIILAHRLSGHVPKNPILGSFADWSRDIRDALIWLGMANPQQSMELAKAGDPEREEVLAFCSAMAGAFGPAARTCAEIIRQAETDIRLKDALEMICSGKVNSKTLGFWLRSRKDRVIGDYVIAAGKDAKAGTSRWLVRPKNTQKGGDGGHGGHVYTHAADLAETPTREGKYANSGWGAETMSTIATISTHHCPRCAGEGCDYCGDRGTV